MSAKDPVITAEASNGDAQPFYKEGTVQNVAVAATHATTSNAVAKRNLLLRSTTDCYYATGAAPEATTTSALLPANMEIRIIVETGDKVSFERVSADGVATVIEVD